MDSIESPFFTVETTGRILRRTHAIRPVLDKLIPYLEGLPAAEATVAARVAGYEAGDAARRLNRQTDRRLDAAEKALLGGFALTERLGAPIETAYCVAVVRGVWGDEPTPPHEQ